MVWQRIFKRGDWIRSILTLASIYMYASDHYILFVALLFFLQDTLISTYPAYIRIGPAKYVSSTVPEFHYSLSTFMWHFIRPKLWQFGFYLIGSVIMTQSTAIISIAFGNILDRLAPAAAARQPFGWSAGMPELLGYLGLGLVLGGLYIVSCLYSARLIPYFAASVRGYFFNYILGHSYYYFSQSLSGDIVTKINSITSGCIKILQYFISDLIPAVIFVISAMTIQGQFGVSLLCWLVVHLTIYAIRFNSYTQIALDNAKKHTALMGVVSDILTNMFAVKVMYSAKFEKKYFDKFQYFDISSYRQMRMYDKMTSIYLDTFGYTIFYSLIFIYQIMTTYLQGAITLGGALSTFNVLRSVAYNIWGSTDALGEIATEISRCKDALKILCIPHGIIDRNPHIPLLDGGEANGQIEFNNVSFCYSKTKDMDSEDANQSYLFTNLSFRILNNTRVALVGSSGSGKSTVIALMMRLFDPIQGSIYINGQDISKVSKESLRNAISFIPQKQFLFHRAIFENIGYGCPKVREELLSNDPRVDIKFRDLTENSQSAIVEAAQKSHSHDFIINLDRGYDAIYGTEIGLSGGQCQRLMIARALINKETKFLILDEATSALDPETEKYIKGSIDLLSENRTVVVVAHKLNTIKDFDRIIVFEKGSIIEDGTHEALMQTNGKYYQMYQAQTKEACI